MKVNHAFGLGGEMRDWCVSTGSKILAEEFGESNPPTPIPTRWNSCLRVKVCR